MKKIGGIVTIALIGIVLVNLGACKKKHVNPYDLETQPDSTATITEPIDPSNFAGVYEKVFAPQCAVSGCHDGTFPPDFTTIYASYNTLVYEPVLTNDPTLLPYQFKYRVEPGKPDSSLMYRRLLFWIPSTSGVMPAYPPGQQAVRAQTWTPDSAVYVNAIKDWIAAGAKDMFGNAPTSGNLPPQLTGMIAPPYTHTAGNALQIPASAGNIDLWFCFEDDSTDPTNFTVNEYQLSTELEAFDTLATAPMITGSTTTGTNMAGTTGVTFTHKISFPAGTYAPNTVVFVKVHVQDANQTSPTIIPHSINNTSTIKYFAIEII